MKKILKYVSIIAILISLGYFLKIGIFYILYPKYSGTIVRATNAFAFQLSGELNKELNNLKLDSSKIIILSGKCNENDYYIEIFANDYIKDNYIINQSKKIYNDVEMTYWRAKVFNNKVQEMWYSFNEISDEKMIEYKYEQQISSLKFSIPLFHKELRYTYIDASELIGYYKEIS